MASLHSESERISLAPTRIHAQGIFRKEGTQDLNWNINIGKHIPPDACKREMRIKFENGSLTCNFDTESADIVGDRFEQELIGNNIDAKYHSMFSLGIKQLDGQWSYRVDVPTVQIAAIGDLFILQRHLAGSSRGEKGMDKVIFD